jgi:4,5-DOPA dioxygenase extradiol
MYENQINRRSTVVYVSHGGGPLPLLADPSHVKMVEFMKRLPVEISRSEAIVVISAHWEEQVVTIQGGESPAMVYDYYGFEEKAYQLKYPCKGSPELAARIEALLSGNDVTCRIDNQRSYDHGSYVPLMLMYPEADIPVIQISLCSTLDSHTHLKIGEALRPLLEENILVIGSGFSFHNMRQFDFSGRILKDFENDAFQESLISTCCKELDEKRLWEKLVAWESLPGARYCHPREEHLLPLLVCVGAAGVGAELVFDEYILGKRATGYLWRRG